MRTRLTMEYGIEWPLVGPGGAFPGSPALTAAVSNSGGLGILGGSPGSPLDLRRWIHETKKLTNRSFGVELNLQVAQAEHLEACARARVAVVVLAWDLPPRTWLLWLRHEGIRVWSRVSCAVGARDAAKAGADAVIVHGAVNPNKGSSTPVFGLLAGAAEAAAPKLVIASGGIRDPDHVVAAMALGAEGVCVGAPLAGKRVTREIVLHMMQGVEQVVRERLDAIITGPAHSRAFSLPQRGAEEENTGPANLSIAPSLARLLEALLAAQGSPHRDWHPVSPASRARIE